MSKRRKFQIGRTYHITHRCHHRSCFLKYEIDRDKYIRLLWEGSRKFNVDIFNFIITSNHVHLLLASDLEDGISDFMCHLSGSMARYYNRRKNLTGSFWEGRYRSTLIQDGNHLRRCMFYIDLNMVRAGVVPHPRKWQWSGYHELMGNRQRYCVLNIERLLIKLGSADYKHFLAWYDATLTEKLRHKSSREKFWTEARCVGDEEFVNQMADRRECRRISEADSGTFYF